MKWNSKDTLDLILMIAGACCVTLFYIALARIFDLPSVDLHTKAGLTSLALSGLAGGYSLRYLVWKTGYRKEF